MQTIVIKACFQTSLDIKWPNVYYLSGERAFLGWRVFFRLKAHVSKKKQAAALEKTFIMISLRVQ